MTTTSLQSATRLVSTCREIGPCPLDRLDHLASQSSLVYWHDPGAKYEFRGLGTALTLHGATADRFGLIEDQMRQVLADALLPCPPLGPRWIGGFAFTHRYLSDRGWQAFDPACQTVGDLRQRHDVCGAGQQKPTGTIVFVHVP